MKGMKTDELVKELYSELQPKLMELIEESFREYLKKFAQEDWFVNREWLRFKEILEKKL